MVWTASNTIPEMKGKSLKLRELFAKVANASLSKGLSEEEATFAGTKAVKLEETKNAPAKVKAPKLPSHLQVIKDLANAQLNAPVEKAVEPKVTQPTILSADIDKTGRLVLTLPDGNIVTTKSPIPKETISQNVTVSNDLRPLIATREPTGFATRDTSVLTFSNATRTFTISAVDKEFSFWLHANEVTRSSESVQIPNVTGIYFIYFDYPDNELKYSTEPTDELFLDKAMVSIVYWKSETQEHVYFADERHGIVMDGVTHQYMHLTLGAQYRKGLGLYEFMVDAQGNLNSHAQFACDSGQIADEDLVFDIIDGEDQILSTILNAPVYYRHGSAVDNWCRKTANEYPLILPNSVPYYNGTNILPAYNHQVNGVWTLSQLTNNQFVLVHILATNDINYPIVAVLGNTYKTKSEARTGAATELGIMTGLPFAEFVRLGTVIYQASTAYTNHPKARVVSTDTNGTEYIDWRQTSTWSTGSSVVIDQTQNIDGGIYQN